MAPLGWFQNALNILHCLHKTRLSAISGACESDVAYNSLRFVVLPEADAYRRRIASPGKCPVLQRHKIYVVQCVKNLDDLFLSDSAQLSGLRSRTTLLPHVLNLPIAWTVTVYTGQAPKHGPRANSIFTVLRSWGWLKITVFAGAQTAPRRMIDTIPNPTIGAARFSRIRSSDFRSCNMYKGQCGNQNQPEMWVLVHFRTTGRS